MHTSARKLIFTAGLLLGIMLIVLVGSSQVSAQSNVRCGKSCSNNNVACGNLESCANNICVQNGCSRSNPCCKISTPTVNPTGVNTAPIDRIPIIPTGVNNPPTSPMPPISVVLTPPTGSGLGDCSSAQGGGIKDGKTDLFDFRQLQLEFNKHAATLHCDFDSNGSVDLIDFNDYFRKGFVGQ